MNQNRINELVQQGEGIALEFKSSRQAIPESVYESVCAFLNRHGGRILLGVSNNGSIQGIDRNRVEQLKRDFVTAVNNPQKINPPAYLAVDPVEVNGEMVLHIFVPESSQVHRCNGRIYDRNEDGDFDITDHTRLVSVLYNRKQSSYSENRIYPHADPDDIRDDLVAKCRKIATLRQDNHPWGDMEKMGILKSAQLYKTNPETGECGITLAGILLLGTDDLILSAVPHHRTDLILRKVNLDRYDDRDLVETNLIESYDRIMAFVGKHLPDPFHLEEDTRISLRDSIFREVASNILIHREYMNAFPAKLIIETGTVRTENSNKPHGSGILNPSRFTPFPKNPVIARFFRQIGRADELGSGMRKLMKYGKIYGKEDPQMIEGDIFRIHISVPDFTIQSKQDRRGASTTQDTTQDTAQDTAQVQKLLRLLNKGREMGAEEMRKAMKLKNRAHFRKQYILPCIEAGVIEYTRPDTPTSKYQKYRLTEKGQIKLKHENGD